MQPQNRSSGSSLGSPLFTQRGFNLLLRCTLEGMLTGLGLALLYAALASFALGGFSGGFALFMFLASFGLIPAMVIGGVTSTLICLLVVEFSNRSRLHASMLGSLIPLIVVSLLLAWSILSGGTENRSFWVFVIGLPCLIYILAGWYFGWATVRRLPEDWPDSRTSQLSPAITGAILSGLLILDAAYLIHIFFRAA